MPPLVDIDREILALPYSTFECGETPRDAGCINFRAGRSRFPVNPESRFPLGSGRVAPPIEALLGLMCFEPPNGRKWLKYDRVGREDGTDFLDAQPQIILW